VPGKRNTAVPGAGDIEATVRRRRKCKPARTSEFDVSHRGFGRHYQIVLVHLGECVGAVTSPGRADHTVGMATRAISLAATGLDTNFADLSATAQDVPGSTAVTPGRDAGTGPNVRTLVGTPGGEESSPRIGAVPPRAERSIFSGHQLSAAHDHEATHRPVKRCSPRRGTHGMMTAFGFTRLTSHEAAVPSSLPTSRNRRLTRDRPTGAKAAVVAKVPSCTGRCPARRRTRSRTRVSRQPWPAVYTALLLQGACSARSRRRNLGRERWTRRP